MPKLSTHFSEPWKPTSQTMSDRVEEQRDDARSWRKLLAQKPGLRDALRGDCEPWRALRAAKSRLDEGRQQEAADHDQRDDDGQQAPALDEDQFVADVLVGLRGR